MNTTDQIKEIKTALALIDAEQGRIRAMLRNLQQPDGMIGNSSDSPCAEQTDPYTVDWSDAPEWADVHAFDGNGIGGWYGAKLLIDVWITSALQSPFTLPSGADCKLSKTHRPK